MYIETERLVLRKWTLNDLEDLYEYAKREEVGPNAGWPPHKNLEDSKEILNRFIDSDEVLAVELKSAKKVIGGVGLHRRALDETIAAEAQREIGYVLSPDYWGNGYIPEAVNGLLDYGFNKMNLDIIWSGYFDFNSKSKRVIEKCGFKYQFTKNEVNTQLNNRKVKTLYYSYIKEDFKRE